MKAVKRHPLLLGVSLLIGAYVTLDNNPLPWTMDGSEAAVGNFVRAGSSILAVYFVLRLFWPKK